MIRYVEISGKKHPFLFGMRAIHAFTSVAKREFHEVTNVLRLGADFDAVMHMYATASQRGAQKDGTPELALTAEQIEDIVDGDPGVAAALNRMFIEAMSSSLNVDVHDASGEGEPGKPQSP